MNLEGRSEAERIADVRRLFDAVRAVLEQRAAIAPAIVDSTGLSPEGVELALTRHLERDATDDELRALVAHAGDAPRVAVVLSSNVFVGALRAIALARAAAANVVVRPSRRDPVFARALVEAAHDPAVTLDETFDVASLEQGEIHVYGRDETIAEIRHKANARVRVRGHGSGLGIAVVSGDANASDAARSLAEDVIAFDQRGCLSPRIAIVVGGEGRTAAFAEALHAELERLEIAVPRGIVPVDERAAIDRYVATMTYACRVLVGGAHAVGIAPEGAPLVLPPPYRTVHVAAAPTFEDARKLFDPLVKGVVALGSDDLTAARAIVPGGARLSALGRMQRPPLDGPVDLRDA